MGDIRNSDQSLNVNIGGTVTLGAMGGSYISAVTAFVVVNISIPGFGWVLWIIPSGNRRIFDRKDDKKVQNEIWKRFGQCLK
ncbi:MAG: hypothetical protein WDO15_08580 [Bacteroidota bacterium]